ncbi:HAD-superfamily hydrolase, subfamily IA, variant 1 [Methylobacterium sp. 4-46]|uniref:HAD-IA family hydrolase n=1 Tax=unclassified Methylobacterium TaxID=2615210 RepID=UPI000152E549|nr:MULTISPECIES: HAD-IA family hydrolase [Methylobacterium]ACA20633.1 HAD-superfamily hydrolase, subfamily IA, variant 1 [Methylobacterium sp. 4-46]WFT79796.1 HAD-IA family hydrolase [Methylobacterium nodulans]
MILIVFDVDGTLVDSQHLIVAAQEAAFAAVGLPAPSRARALSVVGLSLPQAFTALVGADGPVTALAAHYKEAFHRLRAEAALREPLFPGAAELLARLHRQPEVQLGIATGKSRRGVDHLIRAYGWEGWFATVQTADDAPSKPHPAMLEQAMGEVGLSAADTLMIGDTTYDMLMARGAKVVPIGVAWGYHTPEALTAAGAQEVVTSYAELGTVLEGRAGV